MKERLEKMVKDLNLSNEQLDHETEAKYNCISETMKL